MRTQLASGSCINSMPRRPKHIVQIGQRFGRLTVIDPEARKPNGRAALCRWVKENLGPCPEGASFDRKENDGNYEPGNVRWATRKQQVNNRRSVQEMQRKIDALTAELARSRGGDNAMPTHSSGSLWQGKNTGWSSIRQ